MQTINTLSATPNESAEALDAHIYCKAHDRPSFVMHTARLIGSSAATPRTPPKKGNNKKHTKSQSGKVRSFQTAHYPVINTTKTHTAVLGILSVADIQNEEQHTRFRLLQQQSAQNECIWSVVRAPSAVYPHRWRPLICYSLMVLITP